MRNKKLIIALSIIAFVIIVIISMSVLFLVRRVRAYNYFDSTNFEYDQKVIDASGIKNNQSILLLNENKAIASIESKLYNIEVVNIERKFPSTVSINYIEHKPLFEFYDGSFYYPCYSNGKVYEKREDSSGLFLVKFTGAASRNAGELFSADATVTLRVYDFINAWYRVIGRNDEILADKFLFVDFSKENRVYMRMKTGCGIDVAYNSENLDEKINLASSAYSASTGVTANSGTFIYTNPNRVDGAHSTDLGTEEYYIEHYGS